MDREHVKGTAEKVKGTSTPGAAPISPTAHEKAARVVSVCGRGAVFAPAPAVEALSFTFCRQFASC
jgi:hypothetical protein